MKHVCFVLLVAIAVACAPKTEPANDTATTTSATTESAATATQPPAEPEKPASYYENKVAELHTTAGEIDIRFYPDVAPHHVKNFIDLAEKGFYNGTKFHRIVPGFMIQGGDPNTKSDNREYWGTGGADKNINAEFNSVHHARGIVSMARTGDPNGASSQFFIMVGEASQLDHQYSVFGKVTKGMDVADKIVSGKAENEIAVSPETITSITIRDARPDEQGPAPKQ